MKRFKAILRNAFLIFLLCVISYCGFNLFKNYAQKVENDRKTSEIQKAANASNEEDEFIPNWVSLKEMNSNIDAYLYYPSLSLSFPVISAPDNEYYLNHDVYNQYSIYGAIFLDKSCSHDYSDKNSIIYGHSVLYEGGMFTSIEKMKDANVFKEAKEFKLFTQEQNYICKVFSFQYIEISPEPYRIGFEDEEDFSEWISSIKQNSMYVDDSVEINKNSKIVTLSTCADGGKNRYIIHALLVADNSI